MSTRSIVRALVIAAPCLFSLTLTPLSRATSPTIHHPEDGYATIQAAVNAAGCGGTVLLAAGFYNEQVIAPCGMRLIGAGVDSTVIDGTDLVDPLGDTVIGMGHDPFGPFPSPFAERYEVAHLTVQAGANSPFQGIAMGWTKNVSLHHLNIVGFHRGIGVFQALDVTIKYVFIQGLGPLTTPGACILFGPSPFRDQLPGGHMSGHDVHHNVLTACNRGINIQNSVNATVHDNMIQDTVFGLELAGVDASEIYENLIFGPAFGIRLRNLNDSSIHHNRLCLCGNIAIHLGTSTTPSLFDFPPSSNNTIHHNTFNQNAQDIVVADANIGPGNVYFKNLSDPELSCLP